MKTFILLSFAVLGWAFFVLSGGRGFEPPVNPALASEIAQPVARDVAETRPVPTVAPAVPVRPELTWVTPALADPIAPSQTTGIGLEPLREPTDPPSITLVSLEQSSDQFASRLVNFDPDSVAPPATPDVPEPEPEMVTAPVVPPIDIRTITGTRVNMRNGPGTNYDVLARLTLGQEVQVLGDSGSGWMRLRSLKDRTAGWVSASLVSKRAR